MHTFVAAFYAMLFTVGHALSPQHPRPVPPPVVDAATLPADFTPSRQDILRAELATSYPVQACVSCRRMNISYPTH